MELSIVAVNIANKEPNSWVSIELTFLTIKNRQNQLFFSRTYKNRSHDELKNAILPESTNQVWRNYIEYNCSKLEVSAWLNIIFNKNSEAGSSTKIDGATR